MGVPIKKEEGAVVMPQPALLPAAPILTTALTNTDKNKKRKR